MKKINLAISLITLYLTGAVQTQCVQTSNIVTFTGLDSSNGTIYAALKDGNNNCNCSSVRFKPENTNTEMALSILLAAKVAKNKVRIDLMDEKSCDTAYRFYLE